MGGSGGAGRVLRWSHLLASAFPPPPPPPPPPPHASLPAADLGTCALQGQPLRNAGRPHPLAELSDGGVDFAHLLAALL